MSIRGRKAVLRPNPYALASLAVFAIAFVDPVVTSAQMDRGPKVEKTYGKGLPRDRDLLIFTDDQYPVWPLTPEQKRFAVIDGARMKRHIIDLAQIAVRYRDAGNKWWGRL